MKKENEMYDDTSNRNQPDAGEAREREAVPSAGQDLAVIENLMAGGQMLSVQLPSPTTWSPEKRLAGAVLASALVEIRDHWRDRGYRRRVSEDVEWIQSDDAEWPFSFVRLCGLFGLEPEWVREIVAQWTSGNSPLRRGTPYRQAA